MIFEERQETREIAARAMQVVPYDGTMQGQIERLVLGIQRDEFGVEITVADQPDLTDIPGTFGVGRGGFWVAVVDTRVVGTVGLVDPGYSADFAVLKKMFVAPDFRGRDAGTAQKLLDCAVSAAHSGGFSAIYLGTIDRYHAALRFYERNGFVQIAETLLPEKFPRVGVDNRFYAKKLRQDPASHHPPTLPPKP